jgi:hypothetical protein
VAREVRADVDFAGNDQGMLRDKKDIVESEGRCKVGTDG